MIQEIKNCKELIPYLKEKIEDEGIEVGIDEGLKTEEVAVIKIQDFLSERFGKIFLADQYKYRDIKLYLVSDAYGLTGRYGTYAEYKKVLEKKQKIQNRDSLRVDVHLGSKLFKFRGKIVKISYDIPPNPVIRRMI